MSAAEPRNTLAMTGGAAPLAVEHFRFKRPPFFAPTLVGALAAAPIGMLGAWWTDVQTGGPNPDGLVFALAALAVLTVVLCGVRVLVRPKSGAVIELGDEHAVLPLSSGTRRTRRVRYDEITSLSVFGKQASARLLIATRRRNFVYRLVHFEHGAAEAAELREALRIRIASCAGGVERLQDISERDARSAQIVKQLPRATFTLLALLAATYVWTWLAGAMGTPFGLVAYGANAPVLVAAGEWYRLLAANFLHLNLLHLYLNGIALFLLGALLERLVGPWRFSCIYLASAVAGASASLLASSAAFSVGASTAVFGLLGALAVINWRYRGSLPSGFAQPLRWWLIIVGLNAALPLVVPTIDWVGHVAGFLTGALVAAVTSVGASAKDLARPAGMVLKVATAALGAATAGALGDAVEGAVGDDGTAELRVATAFIQQQAARPAALNDIAWQYATSSSATADQLALAARAASDALSAAPTSGAVLDTLATVRYRQRDFDAAVQIERQAIALDKRPLLVSQLGRFLEARVTERGPIAVGGAHAEDVALAVDPGDGPSDGVLVVTLNTEVEHGLELYALDEADGRLRGTLQVDIGAGTRPGAYRLPIEAGAMRPAASRLRAAYLDATGCACTRATIRGRYYPQSRDVARLPAVR